MTPVAFVIFDLDGTLVDSERLCNQALLDLLPALAGRASVDDLVAANRGRKLAVIFADLERSFGVRCDEAFEARYRQRVHDLFATDLQPVNGAAAMLEALDLPKCIASSGPPAKIRHALETCGLLGHFEGRLYSSYEVGSWKPDPGLFQHAMADAGVQPAQCAVVEDSEAGIRAAQAAGVRSFLYSPDRAVPDPGPGCTLFRTMADLPGLLRGSSGRGQQG